MAKRVYRNEASRTVNFDKASPEAPENLVYWFEEGKLRVRLLESSEPFYTVSWEKIADKDGNTFATEQEIRDYIALTFAPFNTFGGRIIT